MNLFFWLLSSFFASSLGALIDPFISLESRANLQAIKPNSSYGLPDPGFEISPSFLGPKLPLISCLMGTVNILMSLSLEDYEETIGVQSWQVNGYPEVRFMILPTPTGRRIERRFVIWALGKGVTMMVNTNHFQSVTFIIKWNSVTIGTLLIADGRKRKYGRLGAASGVTENHIQQSNGVMNNVSLSASSQMTDGDVIQDTDDEERLFVKTSLVGSTVGVLDVFHMVITVIVDAAEKKPTERIDEYTSPETLPGVSLAFFARIPGPGHPPFFEIQWLIRTVASIPTYMIKKGQFREALLLLEVDGVRVADGFLEGKRH